MDLRQVYGDFAKRISDSRDSSQPYLFIQEFDSVVSTLFLKTVHIERALEIDSEREVRKSIAAFTAVILDVLQHWSPEWCLRGPKFKKGKFERPSELTKPFRMSLQEIDVYYRRAGSVDKDVCIGMELLLKKCIELSYTLDFDLAMSLFDYLRHEKSPAE